LPLFEGVPVADQAHIAGQMRRRRLAAQTVVVKQGDPARALYLLTAGKLEATVRGGDPEAPPVAIIEPPQWFGELAILTRYPRTATVTAAIESEVWSLSRERFEALFARYPVMLRNVIRSLSERIQQKDQEFLGQSSLAIENARLLRKVREQAQQLEVVSRHKSQFLASMSHELRTPLNAIIGFSEVLLDPNLGPLPQEEQQEFVGNILTSGRHLLRLINDVLDLSKIEAGKMELHPEPVILSEVIDGVLATLKSLAAKKQLLIASDLPDDLPLAWADPPRLKQILYNLLSNAIKFTPAGGRVGVTARAVVDSSRGAGEQYLEVSVTDTGIGIAEEYLDRIFREFEQVVDTAHPKQEGTGLGLPLVKKFVEMHGGSVRATSTPGRGSTFVFTTLVAP
jgi:signal transduction histidine kinase